VGEIERPGLLPLLAQVRTPIGPPPQRVAQRFAKHSSASGSATATRTVRGWGPQGPISRLVLRRETATVVIAASAITATP
jgi:hypothetical protein